MNGVDAEDSMEGSWFSSLDVKETFIKLDTNEVDPLMTHEEGMNSPLKGREESSSLIAIDSKKSSNFLGVEDVEKCSGLFHCSTNWKDCT